MRQGSVGKRTGFPIKVGLPLAENSIIMSARFILCPRVARWLMGLWDRVFFRLPGIIYKPISRTRELLHKEAKMEEALRKIRIWASHGTPRQFYSEVLPKVSGEGYEVEFEGNTLTCFKIRKEGGFLGIGARTIKDTVLQITFGGEEIEVSAETADEEFVNLLARKLAQH